MNEGNLIPLNKRTKSEVREITQKGGKASGVARSFKAALKKKIRDNPALTEEFIDTLWKMFLEDRDIKAAQILQELMEEKTTELDKKLKKAQIEKIKAETAAIRRRGDSGGPALENELPMLYHALEQGGEMEDDGDDV